SFYAGPSGQNANTATIRVDVPNPGARVWVNGQETRQQGTERVFLSPPLEQGYDYTYKIRASWDDNGRPVSNERDVHVRPGQQFTVSFAGGPGRESSAPQTRPETGRPQPPPQSRPDSERIQ